MNYRHVWLLLFPLVVIMVWASMRTPPVHQELVLAETVQAVDELSDNLAPDAQRTEPERLTGVGEIAPYTIRLNDELNVDIGEAMDFAYSNGQSPDEEWDHCMVLVFRSEYEAIISTFYKDPKYSGTLTGWFDFAGDNYDGVVCYFYAPERMNVVVWRGYSPQVVVGRAAPIDLVLDMTGLFEVRMVQDVVGSVVTQMGQYITVIEHPNVYTIYTSPEHLVVDLPVE